VVDVKFKEVDPGATGVVSQAKGESEGERAVEVEVWLARGYSALLRSGRLGGLMLGPEDCEPSWLGGRGRLSLIDATGGTGNSSGGDETLIVTCRLEFALDVCNPDLNAGEGVLRDCGELACGIVGESSYVSWSSPSGVAIIEEGGRTSNV